MTVYTNFLSLCSFFLKHIVTCLEVIFCLNLLYYVSVIISLCSIKTLNLLHGLAYGTLTPQGHMKLQTDMTLHYNLQERHKTREQRLTLFLCFWTLLKAFSGLMWIYIAVYWVPFVDRFFCPVSQLPNIHGDLLLILKALPIV